MDAAGNLYGTTTEDGIYGHGNVFKLTPSNGWTYTFLYDFTGGSDGGHAIRTSHSRRERQPLWYSFAGWGEQCGRRLGDHTVERKRMELPTGMDFAPCDAQPRKG